MEEKVDLRVQRTYKLLTDALMEMLKTCPFEDITVRNLCQKAMIRPATFYKHFGDKYELFTFFIREKQQQFKTENPFKNDPKRPQTYYLGLIDQTLTFLEQNKVLATSILNSSSSSILIDLLSDQIEFEAYQEFKEDEKRGAILPGKPEIIAPLFTGALVYIAKWWVLQNFQTPKDQIVHECMGILKII